MGAIANGFGSSFAFPKWATFVVFLIDDRREAEGDVTFCQAEELLGAVIGTLNQGVEIILADCESKDGDLVVGEIFEEEMTDWFAVFWRNVVGFGSQDFLGMIESANVEFGGFGRALVIAVDVFVVIPFSPAAGVAGEPFGVSADGAVEPVSPGWVGHWASGKGEHIGPRRRRRRALFGGDDTTTTWHTQYLDGDGGVSGGEVGVGGVGADVGAAFPGAGAGGVFFAGVFDFDVPGFAVLDAVEADAEGVFDFGGVVGDEFADFVSDAPPRGEDDDGFGVEGVAQADGFFEVVELFVSFFDEGHEEGPVIECGMRNGVECGKGVEVDAGFEG